MKPLIQTELKKEDILANYWGYVQQTIQNYGDKEFIVTKNDSVTYAEANQHANVITHAIQGVTDENGYGVGLFMNDPRKVIPAMMGVLKSRNYFVPLDVSYPDATIQYMFKNAGIKTLLTVDQHADRIRSLASSDLTMINIDELDYIVEVDDPIFDYSPEDIVQIQFTSGSTGQPKGAIEDYRYLVRAAFNRLSVFEHDPDDCILQLSTFTYSATHVAVFSSLLNGVTLCYYNVKEDGLAGLPEWICKQRINTYFSTPTIFRSLVSILDPDDRFPTIRNLSIGGEKRLPKDIEAIKKHFPRAERIRLGFFTTETQAVASTIYPVDFNLFTQESLPSGRPLADLKVYIWDENGNPQPAGEEGEIVVYGDSLARGYINNPELTRERFIPDPDHPGWQYFKTGDLGKLLPDGQLMHLGRMDNMVKIKGVRIELDSIERHLLSYPGIIHVTSRVLEGIKGSKKLASYFVTEKGIKIPISDLRKYLAERLPAHLMPHYLIGLDNIPLTRTGKVDLNQLPLPQMVRPELSNKYVPPADAMEKNLVEIWEELIGIEGIGVTDDFFDIGGDSLLGVLLFVRIEEVWGRNLPVSVLLKAPTIRKLAELIRKEELGQDFAPVIPINTIGEHTPLFFIPGKGGYPTRIRHLAKKIDPQTPVYALQDLSEYRNTKILHSIESTAFFYLNEIRKIYPHGPYILIGESLGGKIAYEMAQQLLKSGERVPVLIVLDTDILGEHVIEFYRSKHNIPFYTMLIKKHLSILVRSDWQGKLDYLRFYRETIGQKAKRFLGIGFRGLKKPGSPALPENVSQIEKANLEADQVYRVQSYPGRVILVKAMRGPKADNPTNGWDRVKLGELVIHPLDCYHGSILFDPAVSQLALILQRYIEENIRENA